MQRMSEAKNTRADHHKIKGLIHVMTPRLKTALPMLSWLRQSLMETHQKSIEVSCCESEAGA
jgi:hypothetical protein